jgi:inner membrane protein
MIGKRCAREVRFADRTLSKTMEIPFKLLAGFGPWNWFFLALALFIVDTVFPGMFLLWFRIAAVGVGVLGLATGLAWQWQIVAFGVLSVLAAVWVPKYLHLHIKSDLPDLNARGHQYVGRSLVVEEAIACGRGKVRAADTLWCAEGGDAPVGATVKVTGVRGTVLLVERATP